MDWQPPKPPKAVRIIGYALYFFNFFTAAKESVYSVPDEQGHVLPR